jgi:hypothetical protein
MLDPYRRDRGCPDEGYRVLYLLKTPNGKLAVFDTFYHEFECLDIDPETDIQNLHGRVFDNLSPRLFRCEVEHALNDLSLDGADWPAHPEGLNRWEGVVRDLVEETSLDDTIGLLQEIGMAEYAIPEAMAAEARTRERRQAAERTRYEALANRPSPYVSIVDDESVWSQI